MFDHVMYLVNGFLVAWLFIICYWARRRIGPFSDDSFNKAVKVSNQNAAKEKTMAVEYLFKVRDETISLHHDEIFVFLTKHANGNVVATSVLTYQFFAERYSHVKSREVVRTIVDILYPTNSGLLEHYVAKYRGEDVLRFAGLPLFYDADIKYSPQPLFMSNLSPESIVIEHKHVPQEA